MSDFIITSKTNKKELLDKLYNQYGIGIKTTVDYLIGINKLIKLVKSINFDDVPQGYEIVVRK